MAVTSILVKISYFSGGIFYNSDAIWFLTSNMQYLLKNSALNCKFSVVPKTVGSHLKVTKF